MKVYKETTTYKEDPFRNHDFEKYENILGNYLLVVGSAFERTELLKIKMKKVLIEVDEPNRYFYPPELMKHSVHEQLFDRIFTICPYSAEWQNNRQKNQKRTFVFYPFNEKYIPSQKIEKKIDVIYTGHILLSKNIKEIVDVIKKFNYSIVSWSNDPAVTHKGVTYQEKINLISKSKITIVHNLHFMDSFHIANINTISDFSQNKAFAFVPKLNNLNKAIRFWESAKRIYRKYLKKIDLVEIPVPQIKSRAFEAAFCKSLMLVQRDQFNVIEKFFRPNIDFIYYEPGKLEEKIKNVLSDYSKYQDIINSAYEHALENYTTENFVKLFLKDLNLNEV